jgi:UDP-N-acetylmuramoyl-L-alanyl-D-glutamate--2,6-diaminopimelate ligase
MTEGLTLHELARELPGHVEIEGDRGCRVLGVHHDSRRVSAGDLFVVRRGKSHDGADFATRAVAAGAVAIVAERGVVLPKDVAVLRVDDAALALAHAAAAVYGHPTFSLDVVGVTGTNGKTTTTHLVRAAIDGALGGAFCGILGTVGHSFAGETIAALHTTP